MSLRLSAASARKLGVSVPKGNKYHAERVHGFDSKREYRRWLALSALARAQQIRDLRRQPEFHCWVLGSRVTVYRADFCYERDGALIVEDVKGYRTPVYRLKRKLVRALFGVEVVES